MKPTTNRQLPKDKKIQKSAKHKMPSLEQFMDLVISENTAIAASPSGYNVYNKYSKAS